MRICVCETDYRYLAYLQGLLKQIRAINNAFILPYINPNWLISDLSLRLEVFDILVINRKLQDYNGVYIAREATRLNPFCKVVLISDENTIRDEDFDIPNVSILPKEHVPLRLVTVIDRIVCYIRKETELYFQIQSNREKMIIPCSEVLYMEKNLRKTVLVGEKLNISTYQSPSDIVENCECTDFVQCHRSIYVNLKNVFSVGTSEITMRNGSRLPIGNTFLNSFMQSYEKYCAKLLCMHR